jgi:UDP:flavonoid glycosyltransferase YjiC (YdhE family)
VLVGLSSTFQNQGAIIRKCVEALSSVPVRGIVTLGEQLDVSEFNSTATLSSSNRHRTGSFSNMRQR